MFVKALFGVYLIVLSGFVLAETSVKVNDVNPKMYDALSYKENESLPYMDTIEKLSRLINTPAPDYIYGKKDYPDFIKKHTRYKVSNYGRHTFFYIGRTDYLNSMKLYSLYSPKLPESQRYSIELDYGRGKIYGVTLKGSQEIEGYKNIERKASEPYISDYFYTSKEQREKISEKNITYIEKYLKENKWHKVKESDNYLLAPDVYEKGNVRISYWTAIGYPFVMKITRTDLLDLNSEYEKIEKERYLAEEQGRNEFYKLKYIEE